TGAGASRILKSHIARPPCEGRLGYGPRKPPSAPPLTAEQITVASRFNGPLDSGNGGSSAVLIAALADGPVMVSLRSPVPLDRPLEVVRDGDGPDGPIRAMDGETLVMEARQTPELDLEPPRIVSVAEAREAAGRYLGLEE